MSAPRTADWSTSISSGSPDGLICGADQAGAGLKDALLLRLASSGFDAQDTDPATAAPRDYPVSAERVSRLVQADTGRAGLLVCNTGIGMSMAANRIRGIRAALATDERSARAARRHNAANVLCLGAADLDLDRAWAILTTFLHTPFAAGHHASRVAMLADLEDGLR